MSNTQILSGPASTKRILENFSLVIDEAQLVRKIVGISDQIRRIENLPEQADRVRFLRKELINRENKLSDVRELAL
jgi:hypothetical protein